MQTDTRQLEFDLESKMRVTYIDAGMKEDMLKQNFEKEEISVWVEFWSQTPFYGVRLKWLHTALICRDQGSNLSELAGPCYREQTKGRFIVVDIEKLQGRKGKGRTTENTVTIQMHIKFRSIGTMVPFR